MRRWRVLAEFIATPAGGRSPLPVPLAPLPQAPPASSPKSLASPTVPRVPFNLLFARQPPVRAPPPPLSLPLPHGGCSDYHITAPPFKRGRTTKTPLHLSPTQPTSSLPPSPPSRLTCRSPTPASSPAGAWSVTGRRNIPVRERSDFHAAGRRDRNGPSRSKPRSLRAATSLKEAVEVATALGSGGGAAL